MLNDTQDDELIRRAAARYSVPPNVVSQLLALAPKFENINIYGMKAELSRAVESILDKADPAKDGGAKG